MGRLTHRTGPGWSYFVTTKAFQSAFLFQEEETARTIVTKLLEYREKGSYLLHDFVLMPNHLHLILTPAPSVSLERAMQLIKGGSSFEVHRIRGSRMQIWQPGFHESRVIGCTDYKKKAEYVRFNPVAAKLVEQPKDWPYSSASGKFQLDPIPQGLKPPIAAPPNVGAKAPTPKTAGDELSHKDVSPSGAKAPLVPALAPGLKPRPPKEGGVPGPERPASKTTVTAAKA